MSLFNKLSYLSRNRKIELFYEFMKPNADTTVLDVGAEINPLGSRGLQLIDGYPWKANIVAVNNSADHVAMIKKHYPEIRAVVGDACNLPWPDKYYDTVFSNAVIEHVGGIDRQKQMASEIMRVGKRWFVTTPNRWYPFEFHLRLPFVTWLPKHGYLWVSSFVGYNHLRKRYGLRRGKRSRLRLMTAGELEQCFPGSKIIKHRITFMAETLIVIGGDI